MRAVIFGHFGTLTDPGADEYREPFAHRTGELLGVCRPRFLEALAGSFGERTIEVHGGTESTLRAVALPAEQQALQRAGPDADAWGRAMRPYTEAIEKRPVPAVHPGRETRIFHTRLTCRNSSLPAA